MSTAKRKPGKDDKRPKTESGSDAVPLWHWIASAMGMLLTLACIAVLLREGLQPDDGPPRIEVSVERIVPQPGAFFVSLRARNLSRTAAGSITIRGELRRGDTVIEEAEATIDSLAGHSERGLGLMFTQDPRTGTLLVRAVSIVDP